MISRVGEAGFGQNLEGVPRFGQNMKDVQIMSKLEGGGIYFSPNLAKNSICA